MKQSLKQFSELKENVLIENASKDFTEFALFEIFTKFKKPILYVNENLKKDRILKNFVFLDPTLKILVLEENSKLYDFGSQNAVLSAEKIENIYKMLTQKYDFIFLDYKLLLKKLPPKTLFETLIKLKVGEKFGYSDLITKLFEFGFARCETVFEFGEFAVRGFIIDVGTLEGFFRIEFDGETIVSIAEFNTETQRKELTKLRDAIQIRFIKEVILTENALQTCKRKCFDFEIDEKIISEINGFGRMNLNNFLPLFYEETENILNFLPKEKICIIDKTLETTIEFFAENLKHLEALYLKEGKVMLPLSVNLFEAKEQIQALNPNFIFSSLSSSS